MIEKKTAKQILEELKSQNKTYKSNLMDLDYKRYAVRKNIIDYFKPPVYVAEISKELSKQIINYNKMEQFTTLIINYSNEIKTKTYVTIKDLATNKTINLADQTSFNNSIVSYFSRSSLVYLQKYDTPTFDQTVDQTLKLLESITKFSKSKDNNDKTTYSIESFDLENKDVVNKIHELGEILSYHYQYFPANETDDRLTLEDEKDNQEDKELVR